MTGITCPTCRRSGLSAPYCPDCEAPTLPQHGPAVRERVRLVSVDRNCVIVGIGDAVHRLNPIEAAHLLGLLEGATAMMGGGE